MRAPISRPFGRAAATIVMALALVTAACTGGDDDDTAPSTTISATTTTAVVKTGDGTLTIGIYLPVTGEGSELGGPMIEAAETAVELINRSGGVLGNDVEIVRTDEGAGTGPNELIDAGVDAIVGPASSLNALSQLVGAVDATTGVVTCSPSATALALDEYPDNGFFFRTAPSDSLQMRAIARQAQRTGAGSIAVGYLDDPYGRGLHDAFEAEIERRRISIVASVPFRGDEEDLSGAALDLVESNAGVIVLLGDAGDGGRMLIALDDATVIPPDVIVNDSIRNARQTIQSLSVQFRSRLTGIAPLARSVDDGEPESGFYTAHATDCVNLIALAAMDAESDAPKSIRNNMAAVSTGGAKCFDFATCAPIIEQGRQIDYDGASGSVDLSSTTGDPVEARFESFQFDAEGLETNNTTFSAP